LSQEDARMVSVSGAPITGGNVRAAPTAFTPAHRLEWKIGSSIGAAHGGGSSWPTTGEELPGPSTGPEPQNRKGRSWKLFGTSASPKVRFSAKMNSKFGSRYWPACRPLATGFVSRFSGVQGAKLPEVLAH